MAVGTLRDESKRRHGAAALGMRLFALVLLPLVLASASDPREADKDTKAIVQASYIYNIAKLVEWKDPA